MDSCMMPYIIIIILLLFIFGTGWIRNIFYPVNERKKDKVSTELGSMFTREDEVYQTSFFEPTSLPDEEELSYL